MNKEKGLFPVWMIRTVFIVACVYLLWGIFSCQMSIGTQRQTLAGVEARLEQQKSVNQELERELAAGTDKIVEYAARDQLGYAKPNERVFVDGSGQ